MAVAAVRAGISRMSSTSHLIHDADRVRISDAVRAAEARMAAEIVCVVAAGASEYRFTPVLWSSVFALVLPWPLWWFTDVAVGWILFLQLALFSALLFILSIKRLRLMLTPRAIRRADVARAAERQFDLLGRDAHANGAPASWSTSPARNVSPSCCLTNAPAPC